MDESVSKAFTAQSFTGSWKIHHKDYPNEYYGELLYDPIKGQNQLTLYGVCIFPLDNTPQISAITGNVTNGKKVSIWGLVATGANSGSGGIISEKTVFAFSSFCIGDTVFASQASVRLRKLKFRCTNLETWTKYHPLIFNYSCKKKRSLGKVNSPKPLLIYEDNLVRVKLETIINQNMTQYTIKASYHHTIVIEAKGNRKLPYFGDNACFSYYQDVVFCFLGLMIGKKTVLFNCIGIVSKEQLFIPPEARKNYSRKQLYSFSKIEFFNARKIDESWLDEISRMQVFVSQEALDDVLLCQYLDKFITYFSRFSFILDDWIGMRNRSSYTIYSLPGLLYNLEGLHRVLYPEYDKKSGYKEAINAIHKISPFEKYDQLIKKSKHELPFKQRLQDILLLKIAPVYPYLSISQLKNIIDYLYDARNNAAHQLGKLNLCNNRLIPCIILCEELIAILVLMNIGLQAQQILKNIQQRQEWHTLKEMLCKEFGSMGNE